MSHLDHRSHGPASVDCFLLTVSDTRTADTDTSGRAIRELLAAAGHGVSGHAIVRDDPAQVRDRMKQGGRLVAVDLDRIRRDAKRSRDYVAGKAGWKKSRLP